MTFCGIATITGRENQFKTCIESIEPQVDKIYWHKDNELGDAAKFISHIEHDGYYLSLDDDLVAPPDYVQRMVAKLNEYDNKVIVTCMGRVVHDKVLSYYKTQDITKYSCLSGLDSDTFVHIGGTGVMAFHTSFFRPDLNKFNNGYMADIWLSLQAQAQRVPILCMAHEGGWILPQDTQDAGIHGKYRDNDIEQTKAVNSIDWILYEAIPMNPTIPSPSY